MKELSDHISEQCREYEDLQSRHLNLLKEELLPDLARMTIERRGASKNLKSAIDAFIRTADPSKVLSDAERMVTLRERLGLILKVDETIGVEIQRHKSQLEKSLKSLKHGKTTLESYRSSKASPKLISISR
nr:hypothetical protein [uncultured Desulfobacter sp.]